MSVPHFWPWFGLISQILRRKSFINRPAGLWTLWKNDFGFLSECFSWKIHYPMSLMSASFAYKLHFSNKQCLFCQICIKCTKPEISLSYWPITDICLKTFEQFSKRAPSFYSDSNQNWSEVFILFANIILPESNSVNIFPSVDPTLSAGNICRLLYWTTSAPSLWTRNSFFSVTPF